MGKRNIVIGVGVVVLAGLWYAFRPELLFINKTVNESFPGGAAVASIEKGPMALSKGGFRSLAHETKGTATIYQLGNGKRTLRLTEFETSNGPDVRVYLTAGQVKKGNDALRQVGFVELGPMKGNRGDQNYDIPADVDLNKYRNVTIWCARFSVNFGEAALTAPTAMPVKVAEGSFHGVAHETKGTASIYQLPEGKKVLRFTDFATSNGPDVQVYLIAAPDARDNETVTFVHIAALKGNMGDQNYELPANIDLNKYRAVTVWCCRFGVNFSRRLKKLRSDGVRLANMFEIFGMKARPNKPVSRAKSAKDAKVGFDKKIEWAGPLRAWRAWRDKFLKFVL